MNRAWTDWLMVMRLGMANGHRRHHSQADHSQADAWKNAPVLTGTTKFEPRPDVKNIMVTGGAGFM